MKTKGFLYHHLKKQKTKKQKKQKNEMNRKYKTNEIYNDNEKRKKKSHGITIIVLALVFSKGYYQNNR